MNVVFFALLSIQWIFDTPSTLTTAGKFWRLFAPVSRSGSRTSVVVHLRVVQLNFERTSPASLSDLSRVSSFRSMPETVPTLSPPTSTRSPLTSWLAFSMRR